MWILRQYIFGNVTYPLSLNYSFDSFLWSFPILSSYMSQSTFSFDFLPSLIFSHCYFCVCVFRDLCNSHHSNTSPGLQDFCSSLHTHYFLQPSLPFSFSFLVRMEPGELAQVWMCLSRVIEENIFLKTCSRSWRQLWRQPCCPAVGWAKCESGQCCGQKTRAVMRIQVPLPSAWCVAGDWAHLFYQLQNCASALTFLKDVTHEPENVLLLDISHASGKDGTYWLLLSPPATPVH